MTLPCEFCGAPVENWEAAEYGVPACCSDCSWIPALLGICCLILFGGVTYMILRSLYG